MIERVGVRRRLLAAGLGLASGLGLGAGTARGAQRSTRLLIEAAEGLRQGWLRALAVSGPVRVPMLLDVPTLAETVAPGFDMGNWIGLLAPQGTAPSRAERIADSVRDVLARPDVADRFVALGGVPQSSSPARFADLISVERARYAALLRRRGIRAG